MTLTLYKFHAPSSDGSTSPQSPFVRDDRGILFDANRKLYGAESACTKRVLYRECPASPEAQAVGQPILPVSDDSGGCAYRLTWHLDTPGVFIPGLLIWGFVLGEMTAVGIAAVYGIVRLAMWVMA